MCNQIIAHTEENLILSRGFQCENLLVTLTCLTIPVIVIILLANCKVMWKISTFIILCGIPLFKAGKSSIKVFSASSICKQNDYYGQYLQPLFYAQTLINWSIIPSDVVRDLGIFS